MLWTVLMLAFLFPAVGQNVDGPFLGAQDTDLSAKELEGNKPQSSSNAEATATTGQDMPKARALSTFKVRRDDGERPRSDCQSGRVSNVEDYNKYVPKPEELPPRRNPPQQDQGRRRLRDRSSIISGFAAGDEAALRSDKNIAVDLRGKKGSWINGDENESGRGGGDDGNGDSNGEDDIADTDGIDCIEEETNTADSGSDAAFVAEQLEKAKTYIIVYKTGLDDLAMITTDSSVQSVVQSAGGEVKYEYSVVINGIAATLTQDAIFELQKNPGVESITEDKMFYIDTASWGTDRIDESSLPMDNFYKWEADTQAGAGINVFVRQTDTIVGCVNFQRTHSFPFHETPHRSMILELIRSIMAMKSTLLVVSMLCRMEIHQIVGSTVKGMELM
jgi:hypothetical protein